MAYITKEQVKEIRNEIKATFPKNFKFSITREHSSVLNVCLMASPLDFSKTTNYQHPKGHKAFIGALKTIVDKFNYNNSDPMTDYFDYGYFSRINVGKWDKPYQCNA